MRSRSLPALAGLVLAASPAGADVVFTPVMGSYDFSTLTVSCPSQPDGCYTCVNDENTTADNRLVVALGSRLPGVGATGLAEGTVSPFVVVDGVRLSPDLLPCGAFFRSGVFWRDLAFAPSCAGTPVSVTFRIGALPETTVTGDGTLTLDIPAAEAGSVPFRFSLCSEFVYWGVGCGISGSANQAWKLYMPGELHAVEAPPGDAPALPISASEFAVDFASGPGGKVTVSRVRDDVPGVPPIMHLNGYWDVHSDLAPGSFAAAVTFDLDVPSLPEGTEIGEIVVGAYNPDGAGWEVLPTSVDETAGTATASTDRFSKFVLLASASLPVERVTWGRVKARHK